MAIRINFDSMHNVQSPTYILATRSGRRLGKLPAYNISFKDTLNSYAEVFFRVNKVDCVSKNTKDKTVNVEPINLQTSISTLSGYVNIGSIAASKHKELVEYAAISAYISNLVLEFNSETHRYKLSNIGLTYLDADESICITDANGKTLLKIDSDGSVYLNDAQDIGLTFAEAYDVAFSLDIPVSINDNPLWNQIKDFKLMYCREYDMWFEIYVEVSESNHLIKNVTAKSLGEVELSQINLYGIEINTEDDIARDDYKVTVLYDESDPSASLLDRITEKAPHYKISHVDPSIAKIQRSFSFDSTTIYDAFQKVAEEINCLFIIKASADRDGGIARTIEVYDLEASCLECGNRDEFSDNCPKCGSENILPGYGHDTNIFVSTDNLAAEIQYSTNVDSVKNCFKLTAGDDLMTATLLNCNPNGSGYIWYISDELKEDMSDELVSKLNEYDATFEYHQNEHEIVIPSNLLSKYNNLVAKYSDCSDTIQQIPDTIIGYPALMTAYYNTIDMYLFLSSELMPSASIQDTTAADEAAKLTSGNLSPVSVQDLSIVSSATATSAVLAMAKTIVDPRYQVKVKESTLEETSWVGTFTVTNYSDEEDTAISESVSVVINDDYEAFVKQKLEKALSGSAPENVDIIHLFSLDSESFDSEITKYSLSRLEAFYDSCQACLDILIEQGIADQEQWLNQTSDLYESIYVPYYNKLSSLSREISIRESEIAIAVGSYGRDGELISTGIQTILDNERIGIQKALNFEKFLGDILWLEFVAYRREDTYQNDNYISDGLNNAELFDRALEFIEVAKKDIYKSAVLQHSITATLKNLLAMKEFSGVVDYFEVGNWIRIRTDQHVYKLRIIDFEIDYDNLENINITFSDVKSVSTGASDIESILNQATSMATSYGAVARQANQGSKTKHNLDGWVTNGLALTKMKIIDNADNQNITFDSHGLLCKEYLPITDDYDEKQLKLINRGIYLTDDNWRTSRAGIGDFTFYNPATGKMEETYGVIADTLVGNLILSEKVGIYNEKNTITLDENGVVITTYGTNIDLPQTAFTVQKQSVDDNGNEYMSEIMYIDSDGNLVLNGSIRINSSIDSSIKTIDDFADTSKFSEMLKSELDNNVYPDIEDKYKDVQEYADRLFSDYKKDLEQYMQFDSSTGLTLGAEGSSFKTIIDNESLKFMDGEKTVSFITGQQLHIIDAVIENCLLLGKFFFSPRDDGGVSLTWQE